MPPLLVKKSLLVMYANSTGEGACSQPLRAVQTRAHTCSFLGKCVKLTSAFLNLGLFNVWYIASNCISNVIRAIKLSLYTPRAFFFFFLSNHTTRFGNELGFNQPPKGSLFWGAL